VLAFVLGQLRRRGKRVDYRGAGTRFTAALKPNVVVAADAGQRRQLLSPQDGRPPPTVIHRQADAGWVGARPPLGVIEGGKNVG
jgi:hypothetical protein